MVRTSNLDPFVDARALPRCNDVQWFHFTDGEGRSRRSKSGGLAKLTAMRRALSRVNRLVHRAALRLVVIEIAERLVGRRRGPRAHRRLSVDVSQCRRVVAVLNRALKSAKTGPK